MVKKKAAAAKPLSKTEVLTALAERTGLSKKEVAGIFEELGTLIGENIGKKGPGTFNVPGLMKITVQNKPAKKAYKGINRFTGQEQMFAAKPASKKVKVRPLKSLKDMV